MLSRLKEDIKELTCISLALLLNTIYVWIVGGATIVLVIYLIYFLYTIVS